MFPVASFRMLIPKLKVFCVGSLGGCIKSLVVIFRKDRMIDVFICSAKHRQKELMQSSLHKNSSSTKKIPVCTLVKKHYKKPCIHF